MTGVLGSAVGVTEHTIAGKLLTARRDKPGQVWAGPVWEYRWPKPKEVKALPGWTPER